MERDPQHPLPPDPGGRALERLRQFEQERGLEPAPVLPPEEEPNAPPRDGESGGSADEPPGESDGG